MITLVRRFFPEMLLTKGWQIRYLLVMATETISLLVLSRHGSTAELAGLGLGPLVRLTGGVSDLFSFPKELQQKRPNQKAKATNNPKSFFFHFESSNVVIQQVFFFSPSFGGQNRPFLRFRNLVYNCVALAVGFGFTGSQENPETSSVSRVYTYVLYDVCNNV